MSNWNQVTFVDPPVDATSYQQDITLSAGFTLHGRIVDPEGSPVTKAEVSGQVRGDALFHTLKDDSFRVIDYSAELPRGLFFRARNSSLVAYMRLEGKPPEELKVQLQPAVTVRGRLIDNETDEPAAKFRPVCRSSKLGEYRIEHKEADEQGRFEVTGLLAGNVYQMDAANREAFMSGKNGFTIDLTNAKPGDVIELGDVTGKNAKKE